MRALLQQRRRWKRGRRNNRMSLKERTVQLVELLPLNNALAHKEAKKCHSHRYAVIIVNLCSHMQFSPSPSIFIRLLHTFDSTMPDVLRRFMRYKSLHGCVYIRMCMLSAQFDISCSSQKLLWLVYRVKRFWLLLFFLPSVLFSSSPHYFSIVYRWLSPILSSSEEINIRYCRNAAQCKCNINENKTFEREHFGINTKNLIQFLSWTNRRCVYNIFLGNSISTKTFYFHPTAAALVNDQLMYASNNINEKIVSCRFNFSENEWISIEMDAIFFNGPNMYQTIAIRKTENDSTCMHFQSDCILHINPKRNMP